MKQPRTLLHLAGSPTSADWADLSRLYASGCLDHVRSPASRWSAYEHRVAWVAPDGTWRLVDDLTPEALAAAPTLGLAEAVIAMQELDVLVALPQMFCPAGMTDLRALLQTLGIPYAGNLPHVMAIGADKALTRAIVAAAGVRVPEGVVVTGADDLDGVPSLPVVVKPVDADNSDGVTLVREAGDLPAAVDEALRHSTRVLVEAYVELGREVRCGVVQRADGLLALPLEEYAVDADAKPIRDRADKLAGSAEDLTLVAKDAEHAWILPLDAPATAAVHEAALAAYAALGCRHHGLFDLRLDPEGTPWLLEAGLYCSFAPSSVVVAMAHAAGLSIDDLLDDVVANL